MVNCHANLRRQSLLWRLPLDAVIFSPFKAICLFYAASQNQTDHETNSQLAPSGQFNTKYFKKKIYVSDFSAPRLTALKGIYLVQVICKMEKIQYKKYNIVKPAIFYLHLGDG